jgi:RHS repeat-associated protein
VSALIALASPQRIKRNRLRWRRGTSSRQHYNYFRDYDPSSGRYVQSDPVGLKGGISTYAYVSGNPLNRIDPLGLTECDINAAVSFAKALVEREKLDGIRVPDTVSVGELHGLGSNVNGVTELGYIFRPVTLDNRYMAELTDAGAVMLLGTVLHEGMHRSWNWPWAIGEVTDAEHNSIHQRTSELKRKFGDAFLKERAKKCDCK